jgi:hypothetical protein
MATAAVEAKNMKLLAHDEMLGYGDGGEGIALHVKNGRRTLFIAHAFAPKDVTAIDVTDPRSPKVLFQTALPHTDMRSNCLSISGDIMVVTRQAMRPGIKPAGIEVFDISDPANPKSLSFLDCSGPDSIGAHFVWFVDGRYAYLSTGMPDFTPNNPKDRIHPVIVDLQDPTNPQVIGRWWLPGVRKGDSAPPPKRPPEVMAESMGIELSPEKLRGMRVQVGDYTMWDFGMRSHNIYIDPRRPNRAYVGYVSGGVIILDISDKSNPKMVGRLEYSPPMPGYTHTVMPLVSRDLLAITDECVVDNAEDFPKLLWFADARYEPKPTIMSTAPIPPVEEYGPLGDRFGAHNIHENQPVEGSWRNDNVIIGAFFSAGIRAYDISNPFQPQNVGYLIPPAPANSEGHPIQMNDLWVDERGIIYGLDRLKGGLYVIEFTP